MEDIIEAYVEYVQNKLQFTIDSQERKILNRLTPNSTKKYTANNGRFIVKPIVQYTLNKNTDKHVIRVPLFNTTNLHIHELELAGKFDKELADDFIESNLKSIVELKSVLGLFAKDKKLTIIEYTRGISSSVINYIAGKNRCSIQLRGSDLISSISPEFLKKFAFMIYSPNKINPRTMQHFDGKIKFNKNMYYCMHYYQITGEKVVYLVDENCNIADDTTEKLILAKLNLIK